MKKLIISLMILLLIPSISIASKVDKIVAQVMAEIEQYGKDTTIFPDYREPKIEPNVYENEPTEKRIICEGDIYRIIEVKTKLKPMLALVNTDRIIRASQFSQDPQDNILLVNDVDIVIKERLNKIFAHYKEEYNLPTRLVIKDKGKKCYQSGNVILISLEVVNDHARKMKWNREKLAIFILIHEIQHSIDYKYNRKQLIKDNIYSKRNKIPHNNRPHEKRANDFAKQEIDKWIK